MTDVIAAQFVGGGPISALQHYAEPLLRMPMPDAVQGLQAGEVSALTVESGQRFAVQGGVALVPVRGLLTPNSMILERFLGWTTYRGLTETMDELASNEDVRAIVLACDTPGGSVLGLKGAVEAVARANSEKPVHAIVDPLCASAGYHIASQATEISMGAGGWVGSIGVINISMQPVGMGMSGFQVFQILSSHARAKVPDVTTEAGQQLVQQEIDALEAQFLDDVAEGRGIDRDAITAQLSVTDDVRDGGAVFWGQDAQRRGLIDVIEDRATAMARITALYARAPARSGAGAMARARAAQAQSGI
jgi:ClpP class serine protease